MRISSVNTNQNFKAINLEYLKRGKREARIGGSITGHLITCLEAEVILFKTISPQDGLDTLNALKPFTKGVEWPFNQAKDNFTKRIELSKKS